MKKFVISLLSIISISLFYSCSNSLNPYAPFRERYVLSGIIRSDTTFQVVTLSKSYQPNGFNPYADSDNVAIAGAEVNVWYNDTLYIMRDSSIARVDTSRYKSNVSFYYCNNLKPAPNSIIEIQALLPNGLLLSSITQTPDVENDFFDQASTSVLDPSQTSQIYVNWKNLENIYYLPRISIIYYYKGDTNQREFLVPLNYSIQNGKEVPNYPQITKTNFFTIDISTINAAMAAISGNDSTKGNYTISKIIVNVIAYDQNLSTYYSSLQQSVDGFTVNLDAADYSNITGGFGIFGSYYKASFRIDLVRSYINSFGYN
jgi:hypothetical protein